MSRRVDQPDTPADISLRACLAGPARRNFVMVAGAGSGKTTSLIKALTSIIQIHGAALKKHRQRVACITYTEIAAGEIWADVGNNPLVHVSTIHSFMWMLVSPFQNDIRSWIVSRIDEKLAELAEAAANFGPRVQQKTRDKNQRDIERYQNERTQIGSVKSFTYGTGSDYPKGLLGHNDVLRISTQLLTERPLFRSLLGQQFPFVFVDESQDTTEEIVSALKLVAAQMAGKFCVGFFGDPMQRIYATGVGRIELEAGWQPISKPENFRCPTSVLAVANAVRSAGDSLVQTRGRMTTVDGVDQPVVGTARLFVFSTSDKRDERLAQIRDWIAAQNNDPDWREDPASSVKVLVIVHRMAAKRLGFGNLYAALNDKAPDSFKDGFLDGSAWPLRPFVQFLLPLAEALHAGREFDAMNELRKHCPLLAKERLPKAGMPQLLAQVRAAAQALTAMMQPGAGATVQQVLNHIRDTRLLTLDPRITAYLDAQAPAADEGEGEEVAADEDAGKELASVQAFFASDPSEFWGYRNYVDELSPFSTQQGIKGAEFPKVLVVADDEEGTHFQFSYDKYFGLKPLSKTDQANMAEGKDTQVQRTRRLFYVCCTRAMTDLAVVLFTPDVAAAEPILRSTNIFPAGQIHTAASLGLA